MPVQYRRRTTLVATIGIFLLSASAVYAATTAMNGTTTVGGNQSAVTTPCSNVTPSYAPSYSTSSGAYETDQITLHVTCSIGELRFSVAVGTGGSNYVEKSAVSTIMNANPTSIPVTLPSKVRASDITNIAVMVVPN